MWNYLLNAYAFRNNLSKVMNLHRRMRDIGIPYNGDTFAALMQSLAINRRPVAASSILTWIMPRAGVKATPAHYAIAMSAYLHHSPKKAQPQKVMELYSAMLDYGLRPNIGVQDSVTRAASHIYIYDAKASENPVNPDIEKPEQQKWDVSFERAQQVLDQALAEFDPVVFAEKEPIYQAGVQTLDDALLSSHFTYLISLYGRTRMHEKATQLYNRYLAKRHELRMDFDTIPPIRMLSALMEAHYHADNEEGVDECWNLSLDKVSTLACRDNADPSQPKWVLPRARFMMNAHLHLEQAFRHCEELLMPTLEGGGPFLSHARRGREYLKKKKIRGFFHRPALLGRHIAYNTLVRLAAALVDLQNQADPTDARGRTAIDRLKRAGPRTLEAVLNLPKLSDPAQTEYLS